jgi:hypothetical protein
MTDIAVKITVGGITEKATNVGKNSGSDGISGIE